MAIKQQKNQKQQEKKPTPQSTTPVKPVDLSDEELQQVTGGFDPQPTVPGKPLPTGVIAII